MAHATANDIADQSQDAGVRMPWVIAMKEDAPESKGPSLKRARLLSTNRIQLVAWENHEMGSHTWY